MPRTGLDPTEEERRMTEVLLIYSLGRERRHTLKKEGKYGWARWLMPVYNTLGGQGRPIIRSGDGDHPGQYGETLSLLKI